MVIFGMALVWVDPNKIGSLYSNPNKSYGQRCGTILSCLRIPKSAILIFGLKMTPSFGTHPKIHPMY